MTTTVQQIITRAQSFSPLNAALTTDTTEMLSRVRADQQALFSLTAGVSRSRYQTTTSLTSSAAASGRTFNLASLSLERVLKLVLFDDREAHQVDVLDLEAELAPRYYVQGLTLVEVDDDWFPGSSLAIAATLTYVAGATIITLTGNATQTVGLADEWTDLLVLPLAMYLHQKDPGRDPVEYDRLSALLDERQQAYLTYLQNYGGLESLRFDLPTPVRETRKR